MKVNLGQLKYGRNPPNTQRGALTMFSAVLILILLTEMVIYASQVGVFEQRKSANEARYKEAFHAAESGLALAKEYLLANSVLVASAEEDLFSDGSDGWLAETAPHWLSCSEAGVDLARGIKGSHPCYGEASLDKYASDGSDIPSESQDPLRYNMFYYSSDPDTPGEATWALPIDPNAVLADPRQNVTVYALLCLVEFNPTVPRMRGCVGDASSDSVDPTRFVVTLLSRGEADCEQDADGNPTNCHAQALVTEKVASFDASPDKLPGGVPLTTRSNFPPNGTAEIVTSPNAGGNGVAISAWLQGGNSDCPEQAIVDASGGSWSTCERNEWYGMDHFPEDMACPTSNCSCANTEKRLSYSESGASKVSFDIVTDPNFPCDLFEATFGVSGDDPGDPPPWQSVKDQATVIDDCGVLNEDSFGLYWATGSTCDIRQNTRIGSAVNPVFLVSAAATTTMNGGAELFGVLFITDVENANAELKSAGNNTVYGAAIVDASMDKYNGTFQIVYLPGVAGRAADSTRFGAVLGGWSDFPSDWR